MGLPHPTWYICKASRKFFQSLAMHFASVLSYVLFTVGIATALRPCRLGQTQGCDPSRFKPCGTIRPGEYTYKIDADQNTECQPTYIPDPHEEGALWLVQFRGRERDGTGRPIQGTSMCMEILMKAGECWGNDSQCIGRCGPGCQPWYSFCSNWAADCLRHDVCGYYFSAGSFGDDPDCGEEFWKASDDWGLGGPLCIFNNKCTIRGGSRARDVC